MKTALLMLILLANPVIALADDALQLPVASQSPEVSASDDTLNNLAFYALSLSGTPYKYGGISPDTGFDCSGFVGHVFRHVLGISLPRSAHEIKHLGLAIKTNELRPGDLVFYNTLKRAFSHVGIYLGDDQFVHSPSRGGGVRVENMQENYWRKRFNGARRITENSNSPDTDSLNNPGSLNNQGFRSTPADPIIR
jgi:cell wall-associated NlpC family hydrolase